MTAPWDHAEMLFKGLVAAPRRVARQHDLYDDLHWTGGAAMRYQLAAITTGGAPRLVLHVIRRVRRGWRSRYYLRALSCTVGGSPIVTHRVCSEGSRREIWFEDVAEAEGVASCPLDAALYDLRWHPDYPQGPPTPVDDGQWYQVHLPGVDEAYQRELVHRGGASLVTVICRGGRWAVVDLGTVKQRVGGAFNTYDTAIAAAEAHINSLI